MRFNHVFLVIITLAFAIRSDSTCAAEPDFEPDVAPLLVQRCLECHGSVDPSGGLDLSQHKTLLLGGDSGTAIESAGMSHLLERLVSGEMPPEKNGKSQALPESEIAVFKAWIEAGAKWPDGRVLDLFERTTAKRAGRDWWAWQPLQSADRQAVGDENAIDHYIQQNLAEKKLTAAPTADRRTLLRRVYFDLIGLPPSNQDVTAFERDSASDAYEKVVDSLLDSKQFGERWARHWLDLVRFAETNGYERDAVKANAWRYRDWVINAFNDDMPYDQFVTEQLAGSTDRCAADRSGTTRFVGFNFNRVGRGVRTHAVQ